MKITAILQNRNESVSGHLDRFLLWNKTLFDHLIAYDDFSNDDSVNKLEQFGATVIQGDYRLFNSELMIKEILLNEVTCKFPDTDWILWLDADELLLASRHQLERILDDASNKGFDGVRLPLVNLWRSEEFFRVDSGFNDLSNVRLWRNTGGLEFRVLPGLHHLMHPSGLNSILDYSDLSVLHFGFAETENVLRKFLLYMDSGQRGRNLWRLMDESTLLLEEVSNLSTKLGNRFEEWKTSISPQHLPHEMRPLHEIYISHAPISEINTKPLVSLVSLIFSGLDWLEFQYGELLKLQQELGKDSVEILFVANDASREVIEFLTDNEIPFVMAPGKIHDSEWYINSVYRAYNFGASKAKGEYVLLTNSDMAYAPGFLSTMLKHRSPDTYLVGKLVESGRLTPAKAAIKKNFGKRLGDFKRRRFYKFAKRISRNTLSEGGLYMPVLIHRLNFLSNAGYPEGNIHRESLKTYLHGHEPDIAKPGDSLVSGDFAFVEKILGLSWKFKTLNSAIAYHFQEGEKSEQLDLNSALPRSGVNYGSYKVKHHSSTKSFGLDRRLNLAHRSEDLIKSTNNLFLTDSTQELLKCSREELAKIAAIVTSNKDVINLAAIKLDLHCYFVSDLAFPEGIDSKANGLNSIISNELQHTFMPQVSMSTSMKLKNLVPASVKKVIRTAISKV